MPIAHLAIDLGASSGRAIVGTLDESKAALKLEEVHRFDHFACPTPAGPVWDLTGIWQHILAGLGKAVAWCEQSKIELKTIGVDTWGVDWALIGASGELLSLPHCYRDPQNEVACQRVLDSLGGFAPLYERAGIQLLPFNTLFQVAARHRSEPRLFEAAERLIFLPDLFHYWLSGELSTERTIASTSSMLDVNSGEWDTELLESLGLPTDVLGSIVEPGTSLGPLRSEVALAANAPAAMQVVVPATHDTASAVAAVPAVGSANWAYLSSGTWSLLGAELDHPVQSEDARKIPLTNERGVDGTVRLLKNIAGLWLMQELRRDLQQQGENHEFSDLVAAARQAESGRTLIDPNHAEFAAPGNLQEKIRTFARETNQKVPETAGQFARCCLESLAFCYAQTLGQLESVLEHPIEVLHLVGGGIQNALLNELTAMAIGRPVMAGPVEATAVGNVLVQAKGCGELSSLEEMRQVVANSFPITAVKAESDARWERAKIAYSNLDGLAK